jgi:hypothetical protein
MRKEILKRCLFGAPIGIAIGVIITIIISLTVGDGKFYAVVPELVNDMGSEINAVILQTVLSMVYGAAWAGASVVWDAEGWSLLKMTLVHLAIASVATFPIAYFARWMPHTLGGVLLYIGIFLFIYAGIWISQYSAMKKRVNELNEKIKH